MRFKVLRMDPATGKSPEGEEVGDNWPVAHFFCAHDGSDVWVTTDNVRSSEFPYDTDDLAEMVCSLLNHVAKHGKPAGYVPDAPMSKTELEAKKKT